MKTNEVVCTLCCDDRSHNCSACLNGTFRPEPEYQGKLPWQPPVKQKGLEDLSISDLVTEIEALRVVCMQRVHESNCADSDDEVLQAGTAFQQVLHDYTHATLELQGRQGNGVGEYTSKFQQLYREITDADARAHR
jgi:CRISPR/Cas system-associated exonuclease Cas4 (RecB family)